jgi:hypothetical protein
VYEYGSEECEGLTHFPNTFFAILHSQYMLVPNNQQVSQTDSWFIGLSVLIHTIPDYYPTTNK